jgi:molecular chaperone DnaK
VESCVGPMKQALADAKITEKDLDEVILVGGATRIPAVQALVRRLTGGKEPNQSVNPDEVVAIGAAIQAGVTGGRSKGRHFTGCNAVVAGPGDIGGRNDEADRAQHDDFRHGNRKHFPRPTTIRPPSMFMCCRANANWHATIGRLATSGWRESGLRRAAQIEVTFDIDANGILTVTAKDQDTGKEQKITVSGSTQLSKDEIDVWSRMR